MVIAIAVAIAALSLAVAPAAAKSTFLGKIAIVLGGFAVTGGVVYLAEKLINVIKEVGHLVSEIIVEKYKKSQLEAGIKIGMEQGVEIGMEQGVEIGMEQGVEIGREERQRAWEGWNQRRAAAERAGLPFDEPPPGGEPPGGSR